MSWFTRLLSRKSDMTSLDLFRQIYGGRRTKSGKIVNWTTAIEVSTVFACARVIAEGIAQVPFKIFQNVGRNKVEADTHPLHELLSLSPNPWQTSFEFWEMLTIHVALTGNAHCYKNKVRGEIRELIPFEPGMCKTTQGRDGNPIHEVSFKDGTSKTYTSDEVWHLKGPAWCSWIGLDAVTIARDAIGLAIATEESHASLHKNGVQSTGTYSIDGNLTPAQHKQLTDYIKKFQGSENAGTPLILDRAAKWLSTVMSGVDAQHLETRRYQVEEICRHFRVMPIMVGYSDKATTYASSEQMFLAHVVHTLAPWYRRFEQSIAKNLLTEKDRKEGYYPKFIMAGLLRGALKDTAEYLKGLVGLGIITRNEARALLEFNPLDGLDEPLTPVNLGVGADPQPDEMPAPVGA